jgi:RNA-binding protein YlmH
MIKDKEKYVAHIKDKNEILNMRKVLDKIELTLEKYDVQSTDFFDPYQRRLASSIINRFNEISFQEDGGIDKAERKVLSIYPSYMESNDIKSNITPISISGNIQKLTHKDFLGAMLGLGITREKIGDILVHEGFAQVIVKNEVAEYVLLNLLKVGKENVKTEIIKNSDLKDSIISYKDFSITLPSLRIDAVISGALNISRNDSLSIIKNNRVKLNWEPIEKPVVEVKEGDMISVRGYGRFILLSLLGLSRKDRIKAIIRIIK